MPEEKPQAKPAQTPAPAPSPELDALEKVLSMPEDQVFPWEEVVLPSEGAYYDGAVPGGRVQVRPMGIFADKILATQRLAQSGQSLDWLFRKCVKFPTDFNPLNLLAGDRIFLLYYLRGVTHGNLYEFIVRCTNEDCGQTQTSEYDLNQLQKTIVRPKHELGEEPFKISLPHMSKLAKTDFWVKVRLLRGYDMQQMLTGRKVVKKIQNTGRNVDKNFIANSDMDTDQTLEDNLNMLIIEAMGSTDKLKIKNLVSKLHSSDTATIREFIKDASPGIDTTILVTCSNCNQEMRMELPITESFFRPATSGRS